MLLKNILSSNIVWKVLCYLNCDILDSFSLPSKVGTIIFVLHKAKRREINCFYFFKTITNCHNVIFHVCFCEEMQNKMKLLFKIKLLAKLQNKVDIVSSNYSQ